MQANVLIGGRRIENDAPHTDDADDADGGGGEGGAKLPDVQMALAAERRRADKAEARVRSLEGK
eukprot:5646224-Prymnesium_polylepis.1